MDKVKQYRLFLRSVRLNKPLTSQANRFPFNIQVLRELDILEFNQPVTIFVGENGTGKSTLIEGIALAIELPVAGSEDLGRDRTLAHVLPLADSLRITWNKRTRRGFFLRAEDFFGYARRMSQVRTEMEAELRQVDEEYRDRPEAIGYARMPFARELGDLKDRYGQGLDHGSHGETFLNLFQNRFVPQGLYLLDEPEAPLSPVRQLALISAIKEMVAQDSQFIIATHSPILMAYPDAEIISFDGGTLHSVKYEQLEHVNLTRDFLNDPQAFLRHL